MAVVAADDSTGFCSCSRAAHDDAFDVSRSGMRPRDEALIDSFVSQPL